MSPARRLWLIELACVVGLLLLAAALRLYRLQDYPAGYHNDEVTDAHIIETVVAGRHEIFFPEDTGSEPFYMYWSAPFVAVLGHTVFALRLPSVFMAMIALCAVWALTRRMLGPIAAAAALPAMGVSWWGLLLGRITLHVAPVVPMFALAVYFFWRAFDTRALRASTFCFALAGCFFALAFNSYTAARVMPVLVLALIVYLAFVWRDAVRQNWRGLLVLCVVALILSAPLAFYLVIHPGAKQLNYSGFDVDQPVADLLSGKPQLTIETTLQTLGMFGFTGDPLAYYNIPGRPLLEPVGTVLFWVGVALAVWRWRDPRYGFVLIGLLVTLLPGMLSQPAPNYARAVGAMAFAFILPGIAVDMLWRRAEAKWGRTGWRALVVALVVLLLGNVAWTVHDFFVVWPAQSETRWWMQTGLKEIADTLNADQRRGPAAICTDSHLIDEYVEWWRPAWWIFHYLSPRTEADVRWYDCAESVVIPAGSSPRFAFPDVTSLEQIKAFPVSTWMQSSHDQVAAGKSLIVSADPLPAWSAKVSQLASDAPVAWPTESGRAQAAALPVDFNHALRLTAYDVQGRAAPGAVITVTTYWQVTAQLEPRLALFTHILTGTRVLAQNDHLAITSQRLQPGDVFLQVHAIQLPDDAERGWYQLAAGLYSQDTKIRLPVYDSAQSQTPAGGPVTDRIFLRLLRVWRQP